MSFKFRAALAAFALAVFVIPSQAADLPSTKSAAAAPVASFVTYDPFQIRLRVVDVDPTASNNAVYTTGGAFVGKGLSVQSQVIPELDVSYFFNPNIAVEAICCFSYHTIKPVNAIAAAVGTANTGSTWVFPPTLLLQYHFTDFGAFQPYLGVGVNYTHYFNTKGGGGLAGPLTINDSVGLAAQAGFDYMINRNWGFNADIKYIGMAPDAKYPVQLGGLKSHVGINPVVFGLGVTYRFGGSSSVVAKY